MFCVLLPIVQHTPGEDGTGLHEDTWETLHVSFASTDHTTAGNLLTKSYTCTLPVHPVDLSIWTWETLHVSLASTGHTTAGNLLTITCWLKPAELKDIHAHCPFKSFLTDMFDFWALRGEAHSIPRTAKSCVSTARMLVGLLGRCPGHAPAYNTACVSADHQALTIAALHGANSGAVPSVLQHCGHVCDRRDWCCGSHCPGDNADAVCVDGRSHPVLHSPWHGPTWRKVGQVLLPSSSRVSSR